MSYPSTPYPANWPANFPYQAHHMRLQPGQCSVEIVQQPQQALMTSNKGKARKPIDPPAVLRLHVNNASDPSQQWMSNPFIFTLCRLVGEDGSELARSNTQPHLIGAQTSSLCRLKDAQNHEGGFFVFGDLSATTLGKYKLRFSVFESQESVGCQFMCQADSDVFEVMSAKRFPGMQESTVLSRIFSDQGIRLRLRKETKGGQEKRRAQEEPLEATKGPEQSQSEHAPSPHKRTRYDTNERQNMFAESSNAIVLGQMPRAYPRQAVQYSQQPQVNFAGNSYPSDLSIQQQFRANPMGSQAYPTSYMPNPQATILQSFQQQAQENGLPSFDGPDYSNSHF